ncbi:MAG: hypothetical protein ABSB81_00125 [Halobacteriota archaeon]|jgi:hypothetical protein
MKPRHVSYAQYSAEILKNDAGRDSSAERRIVKTGYLPENQLDTSVIVFAR